MSIINWDIINSYRRNTSNNTENTEKEIELIEEDIDNEENNSFSGNDNNDKSDNSKDCNHPPLCTVVLAVFVAGLSWVVAVAWSNMVETVFERLYPNGAKQIKPRFIYFIVITAAAIVAIYYLSRWLSE